MPASWPIRTATKAEIKTASAAAASVIRLASQRPASRSGNAEISVINRKKYAPSEATEKGHGGLRSGQDGTSTRAAEMATAARAGHRQALRRLLIAGPIAAAKVASHGNHCHGRCGQRPVQGSRAYPVQYA